MLKGCDKVPENGMTRKDRERAYKKHDFSGTIKAVSGLMRYFQKGGTSKKQNQTQQNKSTRSAKPCHNKLMTTSIMTSQCRCSGTIFRN
ncbi:MAG TPA: hypothetical protein DEB17_10590 [Chlorobaculum sp.]|uniref:Uncharacterized protein n=1 Tax=Chlorobaculum tepidum (strain ATCC 49652 / DSM 12025 / NBRC 103806 / TLS) TaxID=194439 RepID=Q8KBN9_CHLTE|nr:hypothetical protein CT1746 [Chlorobaculum tepidum TLS]HBU24415.1 hypothetical protein [Chlorobaculum sp.]